MQYKRSGSNIAIKLDPGEEIHEAICDICAREGVQSGFIVSGIGRLVDPELGYVDDSGRYVRKVIPGEHEMLNVCGNVSILNGKPFTHLHANMCDLEFKSFGGHLFTAAIGLTLEALLVVTTGIGMNRRKLEGAELPGLFIE